MLKELSLSRAHLEELYEKYKTGPNEFKKVIPPANATSNRATPGGNRFVLFLRYKCLQASGCSFFMILPDKGVLGFF
jgi:hypothetical protein